MENYNQNKTLKKVGNKKFLNDGYLELSGFLPQSTTAYANGRVFRYLEVPSSNGYKKGRGDGEGGEHPWTWNAYGHETWEMLSEMIRPGLSEVLQVGLVPTYTYQRMYMRGAAMAHHSDRPSCQVSVTLNLGQSHPWEIYATNLETKKYGMIVQEPGDALVYLGCNIGHYRPVFNGDWYNQLFLHYVIEDEINQPYYWDNQTRHNSQPGEIRDVPLLDSIIRERWKGVLHKDGVMDIKGTYNMQEFNKEKYFSIDDENGFGDHPFIKEENMDKSQQITKQEYEMEFKNDKFDTPKQSGKDKVLYEDMGDGHLIKSDDDLPKGIEVD